MRIKSNPLKSNQTSSNYIRYGLPKHTITRILEHLYEGFSNLQCNITSPKNNIFYYYIVFFAYFNIMHYSFSLILFLIHHRYLYKSVQYYSNIK